MTPERRDTVVVTLRGAAAGADATGNDRLAQDLRDAATDLEAVNALHRATVALGALPNAPKPSESSMVQRIEALSEELRFIRATAAVTRRDLEAARTALEKIWEVADRALDGPSDPDRDRETRAEVMKP